MNESLKSWLEWEMKDYANDFKEFYQKFKKMMWIGMAGSIIGMVALGLMVGAGVRTILTVHFPIGCVIAGVIALCFGSQSKSVSVKKVQESYEEAMNEFFKSEEDKKAFTRQMDTRSYGKINFLNTVTDKYPCRFMAGEDYWMFFKNLHCRFIRVSDIKNIYGREEKTRLHYDVGDAKVSQNVAVGVTLVVEYKEGSPSAEKKQMEELYLESGDQFEKVMDLINQYCPKAKELNQNQ